MLLGQTLCEHLLLMHAMSEGTQEAAGLSELGENKVSLHSFPPWGGGVLGSACGGEGGGGTQGPSAPWPGGPWLGCGCLLAPLGLQRPFPSTASGPAPQLALLAQSSPWPCKALTAVTLSFPACVLCGRVDNKTSIFGKRYGMYGMCFHAFCVVSSLVAPATFLQPVLPSFLH